MGEEGEGGDALHAAPCGAGHHIRLLLKMLRLLCALTVGDLRAAAGLALPLIALR